MSRNILVIMKNPEVTLSAHEVGWDIFGPKPKRTPEKFCKRIDTWVKLGALIPCDKKGKPLDVPEAEDNSGDSTGESLEDLLSIKIGSTNRAGLVDIIGKINIADADAALEHENVNVGDLREAIVGWQEATVEARGD